MRKSISLLVLAFVPALAAAGASLNPTGLRCEYHADPLGLGEVHPRLDWKLEAVDPKARGLSQTAYQIVVASSPESLAGDKPDLWDSGKVDSAQTNQIVYSGQALTSREACWWKVRVWDQSGQPSGWSEPARWTMGLLNPADWKADWIGLDAVAPADEAVLGEGRRDGFPGLQMARPANSGDHERSAYRRDAPRLYIAPRPQADSRNIHMRRQSIL